MSDEQQQQDAGDRSLVRIAKSGRGETWSVSVRVGDTQEELEAALAVARAIADRLRQAEPRRP